MSDDLHTRLRVAITARLAVARATHLGDWFSLDGLVAKQADGGGGYGVEDVKYIVLHDPADAIRRYERDLKVLERHRPMVGDRRWCRACTDSIEVAVADCAEILDLAAVYPGGA